MPSAEGQDVTKPRRGEVPGRNLDVGSAAADGSANAAEPAASPDDAPRERLPRVQPVSGEALHDRDAGPDRPAAKSERHRPAVSNDRVRAWHAAEALEAVD